MARLPSTPLAAVYSPTHALTVTREGETAATGWFETSDVLPRDDFVLYYSVSRSEMAMTLLTYRVPDEDGVFMLIANPPSITHLCESSVLRRESFRREIDAFLRTGSWRLPM